jgi:hypothetical protein
MAVDKSKQVEEAKRILNMQERDRARELARIAAASGLSQAEILVNLRRLAGETTPQSQKRSGGH